MRGLAGKGQTRRHFLTNQKWIKARVSGRERYKKMDESVSVTTGEAPALMTVGLNYTIAGNRTQHSYRTQQSYKSRSSLDGAESSVDR
jgi:hypothetical protein